MVKVSLLALVASVSAVEQRASALAAANPIRKVVTMLETLKKKVSSEGEKEKELYDKYMCYCKNAGGDLAKTIADAERKGPELTAAIEEGNGKLAQLKEDIKAHQVDRAAAKTAMAEATGLREKEKSAFDATKSDLDTNIAGLGKAIVAIEKGMGGSFLQTSAAQVLKRLVMTKNMMDADRQDVLSFLSGDTNYAPASGEIVGILKTMDDEMKADLKSAAESEAAAVKAYDDLMAAKKKEVDALSKMIETKLTRQGDLAVEIQQMKNDLGDSAEGLEEDKKFLADLDKNCESKQKLFAENVKYRTQELLALADTIKILNDDDALELFKKTLPGAVMLIQLQESSHQMKARALMLINDARRNNRSPQLDFIALALRGKKIGFEKVLVMIDDLIKELKTDQQDDDDKKEWCEAEFDSSDDKKKVLEKGQADLETAIVNSKEGIATTTEEIAALEDGIKNLDKEVTEATENRKEENEEYTALMSSDAAAKELIEFAKNRLNKFYNPKLYKAPPKVEVETAFVQDKPAPPPESIESYSKKGEESNGIISMMDSLIKDLDKEMTTAEVEEKDAQDDYEKMMADSKDKRTEMSKSLTDKTGALAELKTGLNEQTSNLASTKKELGATVQYIHNLHLDCDFIIKYFDMRKEARAGEIDSLGKAKAVLSGADFSLVQVRSHRSLRR